MIEEYACLYEIAGQAQAGQRCVLDGVCAGGTGKAPNSHRTNGRKADALPTVSEKVPETSSTPQTASYPAVACLKACEHMLVCPKHTRAPRSAPQTGLISVIAPSITSQVDRSSTADFVKL